MSSGRRPRVLVADDHPTLLKALHRLLSFDCDVVGTIDDGSALLDLVASLRPNVVVVDLNMRTVNGLDVCRQLRRTNPQVKVILISAWDDVALAQEALAAGASAFIWKHSLHAELVAAVKRASRD